ncbi:formin-like protein 18 isoform X2 [Hippoglossus stenolepis]|uniref:formin-like protein 18 isoform X2 n=1 Tax=Hippoglossus stenolepis TaxID=195615 RepID=UPI001FAECD72|nr:formin-like protein 18 isoform X2 [Hippoglossus stenolepis]
MPPPEPSPQLTQHTPHPYSAPPTIICCNLHLETAKSTAQSSSMPSPVDLTMSFTQPAPPASSSSSSPLAAMGAAMPHAPPGVSLRLSPLQPPGSEVHPLPGPLQPPCLSGGGGGGHRGSLVTRLNADGSVGSRPGSGSCRGGPGVLHGEDLLLSQRDEEAGETEVCSVLKRRGNVTEWDHWKTFVSDKVTMCSWCRK